MKDNIFIVTGNSHQNLIKNFQDFQFSAFSKITAPLSASAITFHSEAAHAKSVLGVNGALDFGPLAGDQPGGEGTGKALGINDDSLLAVLGIVTISVFLLFSQW